MTSDELALLQDTQYKILCEVGRICKFHNIRYYLAFGTLLGAIRHNGCIPWDCDIDVFMTEDNYLKFLKVKNELNDKYYVSHVGSSENSYGLARVYKKNTLLYTDDHGIENAFPIHIDVFVLYYAKVKSKLLFQTNSKLSKYFSVAKLNDYERSWLVEHFKSSPAKLLIVKSGSLLKKFIKEESFEEWIYNLQTSKKTTDFYTLLSSPDIGHLFPVYYFEGNRDEQYNDRRFPVPFHAEKFLEQEYGNYMEYPPQEKRFTAEMSKWNVVF